MLQSGIHLGFEAHVRTVSRPRPSESGRRNRAIRHDAVRTAYVANRQRRQRKTRRSIAWALDRHVFGERRAKRGSDNIRNKRRSPADMDRTGLPIAVRRETWQ